MPTKNKGRAGAIQRAIRVGWTQQLLQQKFVIAGTIEEMQSEECSEIFDPHFKQLKQVV